MIHRTYDPLIETPEFAGDETLFSWLSGCARKFGYTNAKAVSMLYFGHRTAGLKHDFPHHLAEFANRTESRLGNPTSIVDRRTLLPFYLRTRHPGFRNEAVTDLEGSGNPHFKFRIGIVTSAFRGHHPLKSCRHCNEEAIATFGRPIWKRAHQWPGVWRCLVHDAPLAPAIEKTNQIERFSLALPDCVTNSPEWEDVRSSNELHGRAIRHIAGISTKWAEDRRFLNYSLADVLSALRCAMDDRGFLTSSGRIRQKVACKELVEWSSVLRGIPELRPFPSDLGAAQNLLLATVSGKPRNTHPLRLLLMVSWLFDSWDEFLDSIQHEKRPSTICETNHEEASSEISGVQQSLVELVLAGKTVSGAARELGVDVSSAQAIAAEHGLTVSRRPKKLRGDLLTKINEALMSGKSVSEVSKSSGLSVCRLNRHLRGHPKLRDFQRNAMREIECNRRRADWEDVLQNAGHLGIQQCRKLSPATYAWLRRNDLAWLNDANAARATKMTAGDKREERVNWAARDKELLVEIRSAAKQLQEKSGNRPMKLANLCRLAPNLRGRLSQLDRMPKSAQALSTLLGKSKNLEMQLNQNLSG